MFAYRSGVLRRALVLPALVLGLALLAVAPGSAETSAARLTLDGRPFAPELATTPAARSRGLMRRKRAPADGMLFVFSRPTAAGFWMKNTLVPLTIVFFDVRGRFVDRLSMTPCRSDPCPIYLPKRAYRFALELRASDRRRARRLGPVSALLRLSRAAT